MTWDEDPKTFMLATVATAVLAAATSSAAALHPQWPALAIISAALSLLAAVFGYQAWVLGRQRRLNPIQRRTVVVELKRLADIHRAKANDAWDVVVRVSAADDREARTFGAELRDALVEAGWPTQGIFRNTDEPSLGLFVAVQDAAFDEAYELQLTLEQVGVHVSGSVKPTLAPRVIELLIGHTP
jgi:hypothetical protein